MKRFLRTVPDAPILLLGAIVLQAMAVTALTLTFERWTNELSSVVLLVIGSVLAVVAYGAFIWRDQLRKRGTAVTVVFRQPHWQTVIDTAAAFQNRERFRYWYPLIENRVLESPPPGERADWNDMFDSCAAMLRVVLRDNDSGAPIDPARITLMLNMPLPLAFALGARWGEIEPNGMQFELASVRGVHGEPMTGFVLWKSTNSRQDDSRSRAPDDTLGPIVFRLIKGFEPRGPQHGATLVGPETFELGPASQADLDRYLDELAAAVRARNGEVELTLATTSPVAFAAGRRLSGEFSRIRLLNEDRRRGVFYPVSLSKESP